MEENKTNKPTLNLPSAIVVAALLVGGAIYFTRSNASVTANKTPDKLDLVSEISESDFIRGEKSAKITLIEYADFSCGFCGKYHPTLQKLVEESKGKIRWVYRHLPIFNMEAAVASQCVGNIAGDEAFWKFADTLYLNRDKYSTEFYKITALKSGVGETEFDSCIGNPIIKSKIQKDFNQAKLLLGFEATPTTVVVDEDGRTFSFSGALDYESLKGVLDGLIR
jgi:protein-disulfide isomerase